MRRASGMRASLEVAAASAATLALYGASIWVITLLPWADVRNAYAVIWGGGWTLGLAFSVWNTLEARRDLHAVRRKKDPPIDPATVRVAAWQVRAGALNAACCALMAAAGYLVILAAGSPEMRSALLLFGALCVVANQVASRWDRAQLEAADRAGRGA